VGGLGDWLVLMVFVLSFMCDDRFSFKNQEVDILLLKLDGICQRDLYPTSSNTDTEHLSIFCLYLFVENNQNRGIYIDNNQNQTSVNSKYFFLHGMYKQVFGFSHIETTSTHHTC